MYAVNIKSQVTRLMTGYKAPGFELPDKDSNLISLDKLTGNYIYLGFCNSYSYQCIKEFELLRVLHARHKDHLKILTIITDNDLQGLKELVETNRYEWTFLHYGMQGGVMKDYDAAAQPAYYLIGPDGKLILSPAPGPGENFEYHLFQIMRSRGDI